MSKVKFLSIAVLIALLMSAVLPGGPALAQTIVTNQVRNIPVTGSVEGGGTFAGTLDLVRFAVQNDELVVFGRLSGTLYDAAGEVIGSVKNRMVTLPVNIQTVASTQDIGIQQVVCDILILELGPLNLNLLGLNVFLDEVLLEITAEAGPGNLLGNLLCAVVGLLDGLGSLQQIANLLNQILGILRGFG